MQWRNNFKPSNENNTEKSLGSYSDLFAAISFVFLFVYVLSTLQSGIKEISHKVQLKDQTEEHKQKVAAIVKKYEERLALYENEKEQYLRELATAEEQKTYQHIIGQMDDLKKLKEQEVLKLQKELGKNEDEAKRLTTYDELLKDIINANIVLKKDYQEQKIAKESLESTLDDHKKSIEEALAQKFQIMTEQKVEELTKEKTEFLAMINLEKQEKLKEIKDQYERQKADELVKLKESIRSNYEQRESEFIQKQQAEVAQKIEKLQKEKERKIASIESQYEQELENTKEKFTQKEQSLEGQYQQRLTTLNQEMAQKLAGVESEKEKMERMRELFQRKAQMAEKSKLEKMSSVNSKIQSAFKDSNLPVRIDRESGELSLIFKDGYFDFGDHKIKTGMIEVLKQVVPTYAKAIYEDQAISDSIDNIEIIGYASPVFQGKYVNPTKLDPQNFWGLNVNMDLSYRRARSIYRVIFNSLKFKYPYQENFFQQAKVSGRSYLDGRVPSSDDLKLDRKEYCKKYDCDSQHKVVIRYTLKD